MKLALRIFLLLFAFVVSVPHVVAEEWRGIVPLRSTRAEVVRLLAECAGSHSPCEFTLQNEKVLITFAAPECSHVVPADTVLMVERQLETGATLQSLGLNPRRFKSFYPATRRNKEYRGYIDAKSGLLLKSFEGQIFQINHIANEKQRAVCPDFNRRPERFVQVFFEHVPTITVECPETAKAGEKVAVSASYVRTGEWIRLTWLTTGGRIVGGLNTRKLLLDASGFQGDKITVTVERADESGHIATASCTIRLNR